MQKLRTLTWSGVGEFLGDDCRTFFSPGCEVQSGQINFSIFFTWSGVKLMQDGWNLHAVIDKFLEDWNLEFQGIWIIYKPKIEHNLILNSQKRNNVRQLLQQLIALAKREEM